MSDVSDEVTRFYKIERRMRNLVWVTNGLSCEERERERERDCVCVYVRGREKERKRERERERGSEEMNNTEIVEIVRNLKF